MKRRNSSLSLSTGQTFLDSTLPSSGYASGFEASFSGSLRLGRRSRSRINSELQPFTFHHENDHHAFPRVMERRSSEHIVRENVLYHSVIHTNHEENEYEVINDDVTL